MSTHAENTPPAGRKPSAAVLATAGVLAAALVAALVVVMRSAEPEPFTWSGPTEVPAPDAGACRECHTVAYERWHGSQHAHAMRPVSTEQDAPAFDGPSRLEYGDFVNEARRSQDRLEIIQSYSNQAPSVHEAVGVIGVTPLIQYVTPFPGGRLQVADAAFDPHHGEWFHVFGEDIRQPQDWGFWKNRSMTWNTRCAECHMTGFHAGYDAESDTYDSTWEAMGISCTQCHGDQSDHLADPLATEWERDRESLTRRQHMDTCATCHARRENLTGRFTPGDRFDDHYRLSLLTEPNLYYPDGQIRDEVFETGSFRSSRMYQKGVTCLHCHDPHSGGLLQPVHNNALCLSCHAAPGWNGAPVIIPEAHSHHPASSTGNQCINCHMPHTTYMQRDPRRDHGFTIPDPLLTVELGIPNACNKCHSDQSAEWAADHVSTWYGDRMRRRSRDRARLVSAVSGADDITPHLDAMLRMTREEDNAVWRASLLALLAPYSYLPAVSSLMQESLTHPDAIVRSAAVNALAAAPEREALLAPMRADSSRLVRLDATRATMDTVPRGSAAYAELQSYFTLNADQPSSAVRLAQLAQTEGRLEDALRWTAKISELDPSDGSYSVKGRLLQSLGRPADAAEAFRSAIARNPDEPQHHYMLALILGELQDLQGTIASLQETVRLDETFGRAWYNLGLAQAQAEQLDNAARSLMKAEALMLHTPEPPFALATVYLRQGKPDRARSAASRALKRDPAHGPSARILQQVR